MTETQSMSAASGPSSPTELEESQELVRLLRIENESLRKALADVQARVLNWRNYGHE